MKRNRDGRNQRRGRRLWPVFFILCLGTIGCTLASKEAFIRDLKKTYPSGTLLSGQTGQPIRIETVMEDLSTVQIIYIGETHTKPEHHAIQLAILKDLFQRIPELSVGMEMFDHAYQPVLDLWSAGALEEKHFLERTHWYANWRYDFGLYRDILYFIRDHRIPLYGLNIPFHLPAKIAIGGIDSLHPEERRLLPQKIDTSNTAHRAYVEGIFKGHRILGRDNFEYFYLAQCVWEEAMAERIASNLDAKAMVVLAGNGHIINKFGIPDRTFERIRLPFRTVYLASVAFPAEAAFGDYLWITP